LWYNINTARKGGFIFLKIRRELEKVRLAKIQDLTLTDGYGYPAPIIFFQGCSIHCPGCHNPQLWDFSGGKRFTVGEVVEKVTKYMDNYKAVVYQGGEPTDQLERLLDLMRIFHNMGLKNILYTGLDWETVSNIPGIMKYADIIKYGAYGTEQQNYFKEEK